MARKPSTFMERLEAAKDVVALYSHAQEVRAVLGILPAFGFDESGMRDGLYDAASYFPARNSFFDANPPPTGEHKNDKKPGRESCRAVK